MLVGMCAMTMFILYSYLHIAQDYSLLVRFSAPCGPATMYNAQCHMHKTVPHCATRALVCSLLNVTN